MEKKDIRFTDKKVDESWKERSDAPRSAPAQESSQPPVEAEDSEAPQSQVSFEAFLSSLGLQAIIHLGEMAHPATRQKSVDLEAAHETIELLIMIKQKTKGNLSAAEQKLLDTLLFDLQNKYVQITQS
jgi:hypothetical protein